MNPTFLLTPMEMSAVGAMELPELQGRRIEQCTEDELWAYLSDPKRLLIARYLKTLEAQRDGETEGGQGVSQDVGLGTFVDHGD